MFSIEAAALSRQKPIALPDSSLACIRCLFRFEKQRCWTQIRSKLVDPCIGGTLRLTGAKMIKLVPPFEVSAGNSRSVQESFALLHFLWGTDVRANLQ